jgi:hypothetical protein
MIESDLCRPPDTRVGLNVENESGGRGRLPRDDASRLPSLCRDDCSSSAEQRRQKQEDESSQNGSRSSTSPSASSCESA